MSTHGMPIDVPARRGRAHDAAAVMAANARLLPKAVRNTKILNQPLPALAAIVTRPSNVARRSRHQRSASPATFLVWLSSDDKHASSSRPKAPSGRHRRAGTGAKSPGRQSNGALGRAEEALSSVFNSPGRFEAVSPLADVFGEIYISEVFSLGEAPLLPQWGKQGQIYFSLKKISTGCFRRTSDGKIKNTHTPRKPRGNGTTGNDHFGRALPSGARCRSDGRSKISPSCTAMGLCSSLRYCFY